MNQHNNVTKLYDAQLSQQVDYCMNATAEHYSQCLTPDDPFLLQRGISYATAQRFRVGRAQGKTNLLPYLCQKGVPAEVIAQAGLLTKKGNDLFQNHVVFPIHLGNQVVDFIGRYVGDHEDYPKYWRLSRDRVVTGHSHFNWDMTRSEIILVEGVMDALALIDKGFDNAVATGGTNGLHEMLLRRSIVVGLKKVWVCFDGDSAGRKRGLALAYRLADLGLKVKMVTLPEGQDPNDFLLTHPAEDFKELLRSSVIPEQWAISQVSDELDAQARVEALEEVMVRVNALPPMTRAPLIDLISAKTGITKKDVKAHVEELATLAQMNSAVDFAEYEQIHPALHFGRRETLVTYPFLGDNGWEPWVVTSQREFFALTHEELNKRGYYCNDIVIPGRQRYSQQVIMDFLEGGRRGDMGSTYERIKGIFQKYLDLGDGGTYDYLTAWTIGTYFFPLFNYYPYLHFTGTKEVGKSKAMKLMSQMCFNGIMSVSITDASQFRIITELLPTLFLDESENLNDRTYSERRSLLLGGYEKGSTAIRTEKVGDTFRTREFDNFSPRVFGSIEGLEDTLASRTVQISMRRSYNEEIKEAEVHLTDLIYEEIRDELFLLCMTYGDAVRTIYEQSQRPTDALFDAREWNLFKPISAIGEATGIPSVGEALLGYANDSYLAKTEALNDTSVENVILRCLSEMVWKADWYQFDVIHYRVLEFVKAQGLNVGVLSKNRLGKLVRDLDLVEGKERRVVQGIKITLYYLSPERIQRVAQNYRVRGV